MRHQLVTEIEIDAPPAEVWDELTALDRYQDWNPFITRASGEMAVGDRLDLRIQPVGGRGMRLRPRVTEIEAERVVEWLGHLGVPGVFDGRHRFELFPTPRGTRVVQSEEFRGLLVRPTRKWLDGGTRDGFEAMNRALRDRLHRRIAAAC